MFQRANVGISAELHKHFAIFFIFNDESLLFLPQHLFYILVEGEGLGPTVFAADFLHHLYHVGRNLLGAVAVVVIAYMGELLDESRLLLYRKCQLQLAFL